MKAVIFDMDGVLIKTLGMHTGNESLLLKEHGVDIEPHQIKARFNGFVDSDMFDTLLLENGILHTNGKELSRKKWEKIYNNLDLNEVVKSVEGAFELVDEFYQNGYKLAIASGSPKHFIQKVVEIKNVEQKFQILVSGEEVENGKPAPDVYLKASELLGVKPEECLVIEDSPIAIKGAKEAGMKVAGFFKKDEAVNPNFLDIRVESLFDLKLEEIKKLFL
jgi:HAD superfamily hydrolase (TIGR01509 family)